MPHVTAVPWPYTCLFSFLHARALIGMDFVWTTSRQEGSRVYNAASLILISFNFVCGPSFQATKSISTAICVTRSVAFDLSKTTRAV